VNYREAPGEWQRGCGQEFHRCVKRCACGVAGRRGDTAIVGRCGLNGKRVLTFVGAGGVRSPLFLQASYRRGFRGEIRLYDLDRSRMELMRRVGLLLLAREGMTPGEIVVTGSGDREEALRGTDAVVVAIRPGGLAQRARDEQTAFSLGVLGQETVGVCGMAMACRTLPALLEIARDAQRFGSRPWIFNFTNPVGITTLGLHLGGCARVLGICDSANQALYAACRFLRLDPDDIQPDAFGLNHLSWTRALWHEGRDLLRGLLQDPRFVETYQDLFLDPAEREQGLFFNEYLYYYLWPERAFEEMAAGRLRGAWLAEQETQLVADLEARLGRGEADGALERFLAYHAERSETYMHYARKGRHGHAGAEAAGAEGYAGVALDVLEGSAGSGQRVRVLVLPPRDGLPPGMPEGVATEVSCRIGGEMPEPLPLPPVPASCRSRILQVGACERLVAESILQSDREKLLRALELHPLVGPRKAGACMDGFSWV